MSPRRSERFLMDRRRFLLASLSGVGALTLAACSRSSGSGGGRAVRFPGGALGFPSPFAAIAAPGYSQSSLIYDTLLWKDGSGTLLPWLAGSFQSSPDHLTYTFELRDNVRWSDGRPLTADDVLFTFEYYANLKVLTPLSLVQPPRGVAKVTAPGPRTVEIVLDYPVVTFAEYVLGALQILPKHVWSSIPDPSAAQDTKLLVGSGAYRLVSYQGDGLPMRFVARDDYYLGAPFVRRVDYVALEDPLLALSSGATDWAYAEGLRPDALVPFRSATFGKVTAQGNASRVLYWNLNKQGPLSDASFRRACAMAIDRQNLVNRVSAGSGLPGNPGFLSPTNPFFAPTPQYELDVAGANALLDASGYRQGSAGVRQAPGGAPLSFELLYDNSQPEMAEVVIGDLRRIGVELKTKPVPVGPQLFGTKSSGDFDLAILRIPGPGAGGPNSDPDVLRQLFSSTVRTPSLLGATGYANPTFDLLADQQLVTFDVAERKNIVAQMQMILAEDLPGLTLYYPEMFMLFRGQVLDQWYFTPGEFPSPEENKQVLITGQRNGTEIRAG